MRAILVGCGKMGGYHLNAIRKFDSIESVSIVEPGDLSKELLSNETKFSSLDECLDAGDYDVAVVASPTITHADVAERLLSLGIKTLVEKPISNSISSAERLSKFKNNLAVGHIERFNPVVETIIDLLTDKNITSCSFTRLSDIPPRISDVGVDLDLSIHDLDLASHMVGPVSSVSSNKIKNEEGRVVDAKYELVCGAIDVSIHSSWLHDSVTRKIAISSSAGDIVGDLVSKTVTLNNNPIKTILNGPDQLTKQFKAFLAFANEEPSNICTYAEALAALRMV